MLPALSQEFYELVSGGIPNPEAAARLDNGHGSQPLSPDYVLTESNVYLLKLEVKLALQLGKPLPDDRAERTDICGV